jgi:hypothetical protein
MRTWQHSHNLRQTTRDRLEGIVRELEADRAGGQARSGAPAPNEQADLRRVDKALSLLYEALNILSG